MTNLDDAPPTAAEILHGARATTDGALAAFDAAEAVVPEFLFGTWRGAELPTGHPLDGLLGATGWWGKQFVDAETVHPLLFPRRGGSQTWALNPGLMPLRLALKVPVPLAVGPLLRCGITLARPLLQTREPRARLRSITYRGQSTAAMVYDQLPIIDVFRRVDVDTDADTVIGMMDARGLTRPYFFVLRRSAN